MLNVSVKLCEKLLYLCVWNYNPRARSARIAETELSDDTFMLPPFLTWGLQHFELFFKHDN